MWTIWAAYLQFGEKSRGSLEPGKYADLVVIDREFLSCPEDDIRRIQPVATVVNGLVVLGGLIVRANAAFGRYFARPDGPLATSATRYRAVSPVRYIAAARRLPR